MIPEHVMMHNRKRTSYTCVEVNDWVVIQIGATSIVNNVAQQN